MGRRISSLVPFIVAILAIASSGCEDASEVEGCRLRLKTSGAVEEDLIGLPDSCHARAESAADGTHVSASYEGGQASPHRDEPGFRFASVSAIVEGKGASEGGASNVELTLQFVNDQAEYVARMACPTEVDVVDCRLDHQVRLRLHHIACPTPLIIERAPREHSQFELDELELETSCFVPAS